MILRRFLPFFSRSTIAIDTKQSFVVSASIAGPMGVNLEHHKLMRDSFDGFPTIVFDRDDVTILKSSRPSCFKLTHFDQVLKKCIWLASPFLDPDDRNDLQVGFRQGSHVLWSA